MSITRWIWKEKKKMNATDKAEIANPTCPYCDGIIVDGGCKDCNWRPEYEAPPMEE